MDVPYLLNQSPRPGHLGFNDNELFCSLDEYPPAYIFAQITGYFLRINS